MSPQTLARLGSAVAVVADVANVRDVERIAEVAIQVFGRIDTWVNNAGISIYGRLDEVNLDSASKHAVKGFTDALRVEIEEVDQAPGAITLIQPTAVNTPYPQHAKSYLSQEPKLPEPQIDPEKVASAILDAATDPTRDRKVGGMAVLETLTAKMMPGVADNPHPIVRTRYSNRLHCSYQRPWSRATGPFHRHRWCSPRARWRIVRYPRGRARHCHRHLAVPLARPYRH